MPSCWITAMHEAVALLLAGFSTSIRESTAASALMHLLHFLLVFYSTNYPGCSKSRKGLVIKHKSHRLTTANSKTV